MLIYIFLTYLFLPFLLLQVWIKKVFLKRKFSKILVIQDAKIGDLVISTPIFREIKKRYPDAQIDVLVSAQNTVLLEGNPHLRNIVTFEKRKDFKGIKGKFKFVKFLRKESYDTAIALNEEPGYGVCMLWAGIPFRISIKSDFFSFTKRLSTFFYTHLEFHPRNSPIIHTYSKLLKAMDINSANLKKEIWLSPEDFKKPVKLLEKRKKPFIGIILGTKNKLKSLTSSLWIEIIREIKKEIKKGTIFLIGSREEKKIALDVCKGVGEEVVDTTGEFSLKEACAFIKNLDLIIGVDTGLIYVADTFEVPLIHIKGPAEQMPWQSPKVEIFPNVSCAPCTYIFNTTQTCKTGRRECILKLSPDEIVKSVKKLLKIYKGLK